MNAFVKAWSFRKDMACRGASVWAHLAAWTITRFRGRSWDLEIGLGNWRVGEFACQLEVGVDQTPHGHFSMDRHHRHQKMRRPHAACGWRRHWCRAGIASLLWLPEAVAALGCPYYWRRSPAFTGVVCRWKPWRVRSAMRTSFGNDGGWCFGSVVHQSGFEPRRRYRVLISCFQFVSRRRSHPPAFCGRSGCRQRPLNIVDGFNGLSGEQMPRSAHSG